MGRQRKRDREGARTRMNKAKDEWKEEIHKENRSTSQGERKKVGECFVTEPRLEKEGGVYRACVTKRSVRGQKCPLELPG